MLISKENWAKARTMADLITNKAKNNGWGNNFNWKPDEVSAEDAYYHAIFVGFVGEFCLAEMYKLPEPKYIEGAIDDGPDQIIFGLKYDLKTSDAKHVQMNCRQYEKKKGKVDRLIFARIIGPFFEVLGWCKYDDLPGLSTIKEYKNGSKAYAVKKGKLNSVEEIFGENNKTA